MCIALYSTPVYPLKTGKNVGAAEVRIAASHTYSICTYMFNITYTCNINGYYNQYIIHTTYTMSSMYGRHTYYTHIYIHLRIP